MTGKQNSTLAVWATALTACGAMATVAVAGQTVKPRPAAGPAAAKGPATAAVKRPTLPTLDAAGLAKAIKVAHGNVVMVNFWATWCGPCVAEFPDMVSIYNTHHDRGLTLLTISGDEPTDSAKAAAFIKRQHAPEPAYIKPKADLAAWAKTLDAKWTNVVLPRTYLIDRSGKVRKMIDGKINPADLNKTLTTLLGEKAGPAAPPAAGKGPLGG